MSGSATAGCCSCGANPARRRRWCRPTTGRCPVKAPAGGITKHEDRSETIFVGKGVSTSPIHADVQPLPGRSGACTPASGWGEGPGREQGWAVILNALPPRSGSKPRRVERVLLTVHAYAKGTGIQNWPNRRSGVFEAERPKSSFMPAVRRIPRGAGIGLETCLVRFDNNKYSVTASAVGRTVEVTPPSAL